ncbi:MAG: transketolase [Gemmatimonadota bacterium]|nr:transketolase [Gemmatimonadota bacterium]
MTRDEPETAELTITEPSLETLSIDTVRTLAMDAVQQAGSGHPGTAMALAPIAYSLWMHQMRYSPSDPDWFDRDRFVLSAGHASILQYSMLHLTGYDLPIDQIETFRQAGSITPGHPEVGMTPGIETTTGPLGQGVANSVGMAAAEAHLAAVFNRPGHEIIDHRTWVICGDGDLMEGISYEAASMAGHLGLGKLTWIYDDNKITIDGDTSITFTEDVQGRFESMGWHVQNIGDTANDVATVDAAIAAATAVEDRPSLIIVQTHIGFGAPNKQDTASAHGEPLGDDEITLAKRSYGWPEDARFMVPEQVAEHMATRVAAGREHVADWKERFQHYRAEHQEAAAALEQWIAGELPEGWDEGLPAFDPADGSIATRAASGKVLGALAANVESLVGGSADLSGSNKTLIAGSPDFAARTPEGRNLRWGVREHAMCAISNGIALHGGLRPYAATFFIFTDYARPAIRLASLMHQPVIFVMTHDSIGLGADGPTHQPVEHLASFRAMPGINMIRPADANETAVAWQVALERSNGPTILVLTRQGVPILDRTGMGAAEELRRGAYVLARENGGAPDVVLVSSGSEVQIALEARDELASDGIDARVVSFPSWDLFREQDATYRDSVFPRDVPAVAIEAGSTLGWSEWVGRDGAALGVDRFGQSGSQADNYRDYGLTTENLVRATRTVLGRDK